MLWALGAFFLIAPTIPTEAQTVPPGWQPSNPFAEPEAPPTLFELQAGNAAVDLYVLGSWNAQSVLSTGFAVHPALPGSGRRVTAPRDYPGFETELFVQTVDLTMALWLYERYFFEASFADTEDTNTIAAGYYGAEDELVRELVVGNVPLAVTPYPYQYAGSPEARAGSVPNPGLVLRLETAATYHELLLQLEQSQPRRVRLAGGGVVADRRIPLSAYLRGRRFVLPDRPIGSLQVLVSDPDGSLLVSGRDDVPGRYRALSESEGDFVVDRSTGVLRVSGAVVEGAETLAVYYTTSDGSAVGQPGAGGAALLPLDPVTLAPTSGTPADFSFDGGDLYAAVTGGATTGGPDMATYRLPLADGREALILSAGGLWSPFEAANVYQLPEDIATAEEDGLRLDLVRTGTRSPIDNAEDYVLRRLGSERLLEVVPAGAAVTDPGWRYPVADRPPRAANAGIYGPAGASGGGDTATEILVSYRSDQEAIVLDGDVVPGTVSVTADGQPISGIEVDPVAGTIVLPDSVADSAVVDVAYRVYTDGAATSDLVVVSGNRWHPGEHLSLSLAAGLRWTSAADGFSTGIDQHPGRITVSTGATWTGESLTLDGAAAIQVAQADTSGFYRLAGAERLRTTIAPDAETTFPAAPTADRRQTDRETPRYRDHWVTDALGNSTLLPYTTVVTADEPASGSRRGPFLAASTDDGYSGGAAVLEWDSVEPGNWLGAQIRTAGGELDLRDARSLTLRYRVLPPADDATGSLPSGGAPVLQLRLGAVGEDLDGDGVLDRGDSAVAPTLPFDDPAGFRRAGQDAPGLAAAHSEDGNENGVLDGAGDGVLAAEVATSLADAGWRTHTITLDVADRARLSAVRGAELVLRNDSGSSAIDAGRLLVGSIEVERTATAVVLDRGGGSATVATVADPLTGGAGLRERFSVVDDRFLRGGAVQRVFELSWTGAGASEEVAFETPVQDFVRDRYRTVAAYVYVDAVVDPAADPAPTVTIDLAPYRGAPVERTLSVTVPTDSVTGGWHLVTVDTRTGRVRVDGTAVAGAEGSVPDRIEYLRVASVTSRGTTAGSLYVDEIHARDPETSVAGAGRIAAVWRESVETGPFAGLSVTVSQDLAAQGDGFRPVAEGGTVEAPATANRSAVGTSRLRLDYRSVTTEMEATLRGSDTLEGSRLRHLVNTPLVPGGILAVSEQFVWDDDRDRRVVRDVALRSAGTWGSWTLAAGNRSDTVETEQTWRLDARPPEFRAVSTVATADISVRSLDRPVVAASYGDAWLASTRRLVAPTSDSRRQERRATADLVLDSPGPALSLRGALTNRSSVSGDQTDESSISARWPVDLRPEGRRPWQIEPAYERSWSRRRDLSSGSLGEDLRAFAATVREEPIVFAAIPIVELFGPLDGLIAPGPAVRTRDYGSELSVGFRRAPGSRVRDLVIPTEVEAALRRDTAWEDDSRTDARSYRIDATAVAVNLFGVQGSRPAVDWYQSDEFSTGAELRLTESVETGTIGWTAALTQETRLFGADSAEFALETVLAAEGSTEERFDASLSGSYTWISRRTPRLTALQRLAEEPFFRHTEGVTVDVTTQAGAFAGSDAQLSHRSALILGAHGEIALFGDIGWLTDPARYADGALHIIGFQIGIEGRLQY